MRGLLQRVFADGEGYAVLTVALGLIFGYGFQAVLGVAHGYGPAEFRGEHGQVVVAVAQDHDLFGEDTALPGVGF